MRRFAFTLEALAKHKAAVEKRQKTEPARVLARLNTLYEEQYQILQSMLNNALSQEQALAKPGDVIKELERHDIFQTYLRTCLEDVRQQIGPAEAEKKRLQALLTITMKETKTLDRLRAEQYQAYLTEVRKEENLLVGDILAYYCASAD